MIQDVIVLFCSGSLPGKLILGCALKDLVSISDLKTVSPVELFNLKQKYMFSGLCKILV